MTRQAKWVTSRTGASTKLNKYTGQVTNLSLVLVVRNSSRCVSFRPVPSNYVVPLQKKALEKRRTPSSVCRCRPEMGRFWPWLLDTCRYVRPRSEWRVASWRDDHSMLTKRGELSSTSGRVDSCVFAPIRIQCLDVNQRLINAYKKSI